MRCSKWRRRRAASADWAIIWQSTRMSADTSTNQLADLTREKGIPCRLQSNPPQAKTPHRHFHASKRAQRSAQISGMKKWEGIWYNIPEMATDIRQTSRKFREFWTLAKDSEVGGYQKFWISLLGDVLGMDDVMSRISFQSPVQLKGTTKFLDAWIPETRVLIEHKARNVKLDAPQAGDRKSVV